MNTLENRLRVRALVNRAGLGQRWFESWWRRQDQPNFPSWFTEQRAFFVHIPKTAGTSVAEMLGIDWGIYTHIPAHLAVELIPDDLSDWLLFATVRDPIARFESTYYHFTRGSNWDRQRAWAALYFPDSIEAFTRKLRTSRSYRNLILGDEFFYPQSYYLVDGSGRRLVNQLLRVETLGADLDALCTRLGLAPRASMAHARRRPPSEGDVALSDRSARFVADVYAQDFEVCGY